MTLGKRQQLNMLPSDLQLEYLNLNQKIKIACIFCDLAKAFACIMKFCYLITVLWSSRII